MIIKNIRLFAFGSVKELCLEFSDRMSILEQRDLDEISYAILFVTNRTLTPLPTRWVREETRLEAELLLGGEFYKVSVTPGENLDSLYLSCHDGNGVLATKKYLYLTSHSTEEDACTCFDGVGRDVENGIAKYKNEDYFYRGGELSERTEGLSEIKAFRAYLKSYIKDFTPETLREGKQYELKIDADGRFYPCCKASPDNTPSLSESERTLYRFSCFLNTAEFWRGFENMRNMHSIKKPLLVRDLLERLDMSIDVTELTERLRTLDRQIILLTTPNTINFSE